MYVYGIGMDKDLALYIIKGRMGIKYKILRLSIMKGCIAPCNSSVHIFKLIRETY